jgi:hypothetical protein
MGLLGIGGFPKINLGKIVGGPLLNGIKNTLKTIVGHSGKSSFDAVRRNPLEQSIRPLSLGSPAKAGIGAPGAGALSSPDTDYARKLVSDNMGPEGLKLFNSATPDQQKELATQALVQKMTRTNQLLTSLLQSLHEMSKAIIQNTRA